VLFNPSSGKGGIKGGITGRRRRSGGGEEEADFIREQKMRRKGG